MYVRVALERIKLKLTTLCLAPCFRIKCQLHEHNQYWITLFYNLYVACIERVSNVYITGYNLCASNILNIKIQLALNLL